jgi:hypothetical protein
LGKRAEVIVGFWVFSCRNGKKQAGVTGIVTGDSESFAILVKGEYCRCYIVLRES